MFKGNDTPKFPNQLNDSITTWIDPSDSSLVSPSRTSVQDSAANPYVDIESLPDDRLNSFTETEKSSEYRPESRLNESRKMTWKEEELAALTSVLDKINKKYKTATKKMQKTKDDLKAECIST